MIIPEFMSSMFYAMWFMIQKSIKKCKTNLLQGLKPSFIYFMKVIIG